MVLLLSYLPLAGFTITAWLLSLRISKYEIMSPLSLMMLGLSVSIILAIIGLSSWNQVGLSTNATMILILGEISLLGGGIAASCLCQKRLSLDKETDDAIYNAYLSPLWKYIIVAIILFVALSLRVYETYQIAIQNGIDTSSYSVMAKNVRELLAPFKSSSGMKLGSGFSVVERQLEKVAIISGYVSAYLFAKAIHQRDKKRAIFSGFLLAESSAFCFVSGNRGTILYYAIALVALFALVALKSGLDAQVIAKRIFLTGVILGLFASVAFWASGALVGRKTQSGLIEYISFYFGCGAPTFQALLNDRAVIADSVPGVWSFYYLFSLPYKFGLIPTYPSYSIAWLNMGGHPSNIFTGFARYYLDFGIFGVVVLSFIAAFALTMLYRFARAKGLGFAAVVVCLVSAYSFDFAREEFVFSRFLSTTWAVSFAIMFVLTLFMTCSLREQTYKLIGTKGAHFVKRPSSHRVKGN